MDLFNYENYKAYVNDWIKNQPNDGYGMYRKLAKILRLAPVTVSQIFKGKRELPIESAITLAQFLKLNHLEKKYLILLIQKARSGSFELTQYLEDEIQNLRYEADSLKSVTPTEISLSEPELARFHSSWVYSAARQLTAIEKFQNVKNLSRALQLSEENTQEILKFLVSTGLCHFNENKYSPGVRHTHLPEGSPYIIHRQTSWRLKGIERMPFTSSDELFYTSCITMSKDDVPKVRKQLVKAISAIRDIVDNSESQELVCLNIDWFNLTKSLVNE